MKQDLTIPVLLGIKNYYSVLRGFQGGNKISSQIHKKNLKIPQHIDRMSILVWNYPKYINFNLKMAQLFPQSLLKEKKNTQNESFNTEF